MSEPPVRGCAASARRSGAASTAPDNWGYTNTTRCVSACAVLLVRRNGTPMLRAGDEFLQTQGGNNNPYNQDEPTWLDWRRQRWWVSGRVLVSQMGFPTRRTWILDRGKLQRQPVCLGRL